MLMFKILFLFISIWFTGVNIIRSMKKLDTPGINFAIMAFGWTGFITLQWLI